MKCHRKPSSMSNQYYQGYQIQPGDAKPPAVITEPPIILSRGFRSGLPALAICLPSRGTVFSRAVESIVREATLCVDHRVALFMSHGEGIPQAQQGLITRAMEWGANRVWLVEEDNVMPFGVLRALLARMSSTTWVAGGPAPKPDVVSCGYADHNGHNWVVPEWHERMKFHAFGCTLVEASVWRRIGAPYCFNGSHIGFGADGEPYEIRNTGYDYGGQDIDFSYRIHKLGIESAHLDRRVWRCGHLHMTKPGNRFTNTNGVATVVQM